MAKFKLNDIDRNVVIGYACISALVVLVVGLVLVQFGYFDAEGATTGFIPNCVPVDMVCGNKGCKPDGDNQIVHGVIQEQYQ